MLSKYLLAYTYAGGCVVYSGNTLVSINVVALHWARLLLGCWHVNRLGTVVRTQQSRSTQPSIPLG